MHSRSSTQSACRFAAQRLNSSARSTVSQHMTFE
jgi:hypothetical protein